MPAPDNRNQLPVVGPMLLYLLPLPLLPAVFIGLLKGNFQHFLVSLTALVLLWGGAWLTRRGIKRDVDTRRLGWSRLPARPWKLLGGLAAGAATGLCTLLILRRPPVLGVAVAATTLAGVVLSYGIDSVFSQRFQRAPVATRDREVADLLEEARLKIDSIDRASRQIHNPELNRRIRRINARAVDILAIIADDPVVVRRARKFLKVYLDGAQRVTEGYARVHRDQPSRQLEDNFRNVLVTIEDTFAEQQRKLIEKDALDLDVQIEVLTRQLKEEGVI